MSVPLEKICPSCSKKFIPSLEKCPLCNFKLEHNFDYCKYDPEGYDRNGYDKHGFDRKGYDKKGFNRNGINKDTGTEYDRYGYDRYGYDREGYDRYGYDKKGFNMNGIHKDTGTYLDQNWLDKNGNGISYNHYRLGAYIPKKSKPAQDEFSKCILLFKNNDMNTVDMFIQKCNNFIREKNNCRYYSSNS